MIDIVLINPAAAHGIYGALGEKLIAVEPPPWLRMTAGHLRQHGFSVAVIDAERERISAKIVGQRVEELNPRVTAILAYGHQPSASTQQMFGAREVAVALGGARATVLLGGHVSAIPERTLNEELIEFIVKGEGPITLKALLTGTDPMDIPGLGWRDNQSRPHINPPAPALDLDRDLTDHAWDLVDPRGYVCHNWHAFDEPARRSPYASIYTTLNCPFACSFCCISSPFGGSGYQTRSSTSVVDEIEDLYRNYGVRRLKIADEMFVLKPSHYVPICEEIIRRGLGEDLSIWCYARVDTVKPIYLSLLRAAGVRWLALGIESGNADVRDGADKRLRTGDIVDVVRTIQRHEISVIGNFIFGLRDDTLETMHQTLALALACMPEFANFYSCMAYPGSRLYDQAVKENWVLPAEWRGYSQHNEYCRPLDTAHVNAATVLRFRDAAFRTFFSMPAYRSYVRGRFGDPAEAAIEEMLAYRLKRNLLV